MMSLPAGGGEPATARSLAGGLGGRPGPLRPPLGRDTGALGLGGNRRYGRADYLPCIVWGSLAQRCASLGVGDGVRLEGRLQSRAYTKLESGESCRRTAFEVSVMRLEGGEV